MEVIVESGLSAAMTKVSSPAWLELISEDDPLDWLDRFESRDAWERCDLSEREPMLCVESSLFVRAVRVPELIAVWNPSLSSSLRRSRL